MKRSMVFHRGLLETKMEEIPEVTKKLAPFAKKQSRNIIMEKKIRKRYHSEEAVKKALKIESFRNLTKDKVMEFTSMIPYMEKEVALEKIKKNMNKQFMHISMFLRPSQISWNKKT